MKKKLKELESSTEEREQITEHLNGLLLAS